MYKGSDGKVIFFHDYRVLVEEMGLKPSFSDSQFILSSLTDCKENQEKARVIILIVEKEMATHSSVLAWRIRGTGEPGGLPSMGLHRVAQSRTLKRLSSSSSSGNTVF